MNHLLRHYMLLSGTSPQRGLRNGDFEQQLAYWTTPVEVGFSACSANGAAHSGAWSCLFLLQNPAGTQRDLISEPFGVAPGVERELHFWLHVNGLKSWASFRIEHYRDGLESSRVLIAEVESVDLTDVTWNEMSFTVTPLTNQDRLYFAGINDGDPASENMAFRIDDLTYEPT